MIGGLLRFAPGRLGARTARAPACRVIGWWVVSWLPCVTPGDELEPAGPRPHEGGPGGAVWAGMATGSAIRACVSRDWLKREGMKGRAIWPADVKDDAWCQAPGCAAEGMAVPLAVKELRPLRGAFGVLDREPPARHRQKGRQARCLPQQTPRSPLQRPCLGSSFGSSSGASTAVPGGPRPGFSLGDAPGGTSQYPSAAVS